MYKRQPRGWIDSIRTAARGGERVLADRLDGAIASADLSLKSGTGWWWFVDVLQWLLFAAALTGLVWLALPLAFVFFQLPIALPHVTFWGWPAPTVLAVSYTHLDVYKRQPYNRAHRPS